MKNKHLGFSLVELITVIILISILAVNVIPKLSGTDSFEAYTYRSQLIADLRLTQQRAMQQTSIPHNSASDYCHQIIFDGDRYGIPDRLDCTVKSFPVDWQPDGTGKIVQSEHDVTFSISGSSFANQVIFDGMGRPNCIAGCTITVASAVESIQIKIESEGYIHAL